MSKEPRFSVPGSHRTLPPHAVRQGSVADGETVEVTLRLRSRAPLSPAAPLASGPTAAAPGPGVPLSREAFEAAHGADPGDLRRIEDFAHEHHLTVVESSAARRTVIVSGHLADLQAAFGVTLHSYTLNAQTFRGRSGDISVPQELAGVIEGVFGLDDRPQASPHFRLASPVAPDQADQVDLADQASTALTPRVPALSFTPPQLARAYNFPAGMDGQGQTIAIIELGGGYRKGDLDTYFHGLGLTSPKVTAVSVNGGLNKPTGDPGGPDGEVMLDIEVVGAVAPGARIVVYFAPNTDAGFLNAVTQATHDRVRAPSVMSISWGSAESAWTGQAMQAMNSAFQDAAMMGLSVFCAAGDDGSADRVSGGLQHTDFPASSTWVTGCGGTRLTLQGGVPVAEVVWNNGPGNGASGGGVSDVFALPDYQAGAGVPPSANPGGRVGRGVPDVSGVADPQTGYRVRVDGADTVIGGTSAVAPLWAGLSALLNQALGRPVGFLNPQLYALGPVRDTVMRDIVTGNNGAYVAGPGWDACTGLGSPDGARLLAALSPAPQKPKGS